MIERLKGRVAEVKEDGVVLWVGPVALFVEMARPALASIQPGAELELFARLLLREDGINLYGFLDPKERLLFDRLISAPGVGPRMALSLLSTLGAPLIARAVLEGDAKSLTAAPGVGKKLAERILLELKNKLPAELAAAGPKALNPHAQEAIEALLLLGFREGPVRQVVARLAGEAPEAPPEELIRLALKELR